MELRARRSSVDSLSFRQGEGSSFGLEMGATDMCKYYYLRPGCRVKYELQRGAGVTPGSS